MKTRTCLARRVCRGLTTRLGRTVVVAGLAAWLLTLPATTDAQFAFSTNNGALALTNYSGSGGAVTVPGTFGGLPITQIGGDAFYHATNLAMVTVSSGVTNIGPDAFDNCANLTNAILPDTVADIGDYAFFFCTRLTQVTLGRGVTSIGTAAFSYCTSLANLTLPAAVSLLGNQAFFGCSNLAGVYFLGQAPALGAQVFAPETNSATIYYLPGTNGWGANFGNCSAVAWDPHVQAGGAGFGVRTNHFGFNIAWAGGKIVVVEASTNLANPGWFPVGTNTFSGGLSYFNDPLASGSLVRFYRLRSP